MMIPIVAPSVVADHIPPTRDVPCSLHSAIIRESMLTPLNCAYISLLPLLTFVFAVSCGADAKIENVIMINVIIARDMGLG